MKKFLFSLFSFACLVFLQGNSFAATVQVDATNSQFTPKTVTINAGDTIKWVNKTSTIPHTSTSGQSCTPDGKWDSGTLQPGASFSRVFNTAGTFPYFCTFHCSIGMTGTITVNGGTCTTFDEVIAQYDLYVSGQAAWTDVIDCYNQYVAQ